jgi:outer membrane protein TolC
MHAASLESPAQAKALPEPVFSFGYFLSSPETRVGPQEWTFRLSQKLPFFGKQGLKGDIATTEAEVWGQTYDARTLDLIRDVKHAYYEYYRVHEVIRITEEERHVLGEMQNIAQVKYASGTATQQDVLKAQLALSRLDDRLTTLRRDLVSVTARLNDLLNRPPTAALAEPHFDEPLIDLTDVDALVERALAGRPDAAVADLNIEKAELSRSLAKRQYYPDLTLAVNYVTVRERPVPVEDNGKDILHVGASISLPIWYGKLGAAVKESEARIAVARHQRIGLWTRVRNEVRDAYSRVESARELVALHRDVIIPQAEQTFLASQTGYQTGRVDFLDLLDSERMLLSVRHTYFALVADLGKQAADLERTLGEGRRSP